MAIITSKPELANGVEYPYLGVNLAISPVWQESNIGASVAIVFTPFRVTDSGAVERLPGKERPCIYGDAYMAALTDPALAQAVETILGAIQQFVTDKGL